jgi:TolB-like protein
MPFMGAEPISFGPFTLDRSAATLLSGGKPVGLGQRAYALLETLAGADGPVDKAALMEAAWPGTVVEEGNLTVQIAALRKALGTRPDGQEWIVTVPRVGYRLIVPAAVAPDPLPAEPADLPGGKPLIAVLPFHNFSSEAEQGYFADGVVEDIITALSRFKQFAVIARNSSFVYKDKAVDVRVAAKELGVRYMLEGSVRRGGDRVRVTAQLIDADNGAHIWAEKFDGNLADIFDFQDSITESVVGLIEPQIRKTEIERTRRKRPDSLDAYDLMLRAAPLILGPDREYYTNAVDLLHRAIALDPGYALAYAMCGWAHEKRYTFRVPVPEGIDDKAMAIEMSEKALALERDDAAVLAIAAWNVILLERDVERGMSLAERAVALNPNHLMVLNFAGLCCQGAGHLERSATLNMRALRLSPGAPDAYWTLTSLGCAAFLLGNAEEAVDWCQKAIAINDGWEATWMIVGAANAMLGRMVEARRAVERLLELNPASGAIMAKRSVWLPRHTEMIRDHLIMAGLPRE